MTQPRSNPPGGFNKPIQLSLWIRDALAGGRVTWANELHQEYVQAVRATRLIPKHYAKGRPRVGGKRRVISYEGFRTYIYMFHRMGLIEYVSPTGPIVADTKHQKSGAITGQSPDLFRRNYFRAVPSELSNVAWSNPWQFYQSHSRLQF